MPPLCRETSVSRTANVGTVGMNGLNTYQHELETEIKKRLAASGPHFGLGEEFVICQDVSKLSIEVTFWRTSSDLLAML